MEPRRCRQALRRPSGQIPASPNSKRKAAEAASLLKLLANENRLLILCRLAVAREMSVSDLADAVGLSQSALSQHLAKMREDGLVATRREAQTMFYRIADPNAARLLGAAQEHLLPVIDETTGEQSMSNLQTISPATRRRADARGRRAGRHPRGRRARARAHSRRAPSRAVAASTADIAAARRRRRADLPLPLRRAHQGQCRQARRRRAGMRDLYPRRRPRRLEEGRPAGRRSTAASRSTSCARCRSPPAAWCCSASLLGVFVAPGLLCACRDSSAPALLFAGVTGFCGMARLLALMPWNRRRQRIIADLRWQ